MAEIGFRIQQEGQEGLVGIFEDDGETGTLYLFDSRAGYDEEGILAWIPVYVRSSAFAPTENEIWVAWSIDFRRVAAIVKGLCQNPRDCFRAVIDSRSKQTCNRFMKDASAEPLRDSAWLTGFEWTWSEDAN
jgi:hypothetical protein